jgi:hypothetical protein
VKLMLYIAVETLREEEEEKNKNKMASVANS